MTRTLRSAWLDAARSTLGVSFISRNESERGLGYATLVERSRSVAANLATLGIGPGQQVALVLPTGPEFYDAFFGVTLLGAVPVPLYPPVRLGKLDEYHRQTASMLRRADVRLVITSRRLYGILWRSIEAARPRLGCVEIEALRTNPSRVDMDVDGYAAPPRDAPALVQFSSGTTGAPKPVVLTHAQVMANVQAITQAILESFPEHGFVHRCVSWLPLYHDMGLIGCVLTAMARPADLTLIPPELFVARPAVWLRTLSRHRATITAAPNFAYSLAAERVRDDELEGCDLSSLRLALNGAEPVTDLALERFNQRFARYGLRPTALTPVYGLAEATLAVCFSHPRETFVARTFDPHALSEHGRAIARAEGRRIVSVGRPLRGIEVRITDEHGAELPEGHLGRVQVQSPSVMRGYHGDAAASAQAFSDGWLDTGDTGFLLHGELHLHGRRKDLIIVRGRKYAPQELEHIVDEISGVRRGCAAAVSTFREDLGREALFVFVEHVKGWPTSRRGPLARAVRRAIAGALGLVIDDAIVLAPGTLPRTSSGKIRRQQTLALYQRGELRPPSATPRLALLAELLRSHVKSSRARG